MVWGDRAVVAGVDGTGTSERAAVWAAGRAAVLGLPLVLVYGMRWPVHAQAHLHMPVDPGAVDPGAAEEPVRRWARDVLDALARRCREEAGVEVRTEVFSGDPADAVILAADRTAFVVVGHSHRGGVARFLLGSTAERLTRSCPWPVVVVRDGAAADERRARGPVVVGADGSPEGDRAVRFAFAFAASHDAEVVLVHATDDALTTAVDPAQDEPRDGRGSVVAECARRHPGVAHRLVVAAGPPADALLAASAEAGLLVVGSRGRGAVRRAFLGSVSHALVDSAPCPVAVLPPETAATDPV